MTTLCLCDVNEHDLRVFAEIAAARRPTACASALAEADRATGGYATTSKWSIIEPAEGSA